MTVEQNVARPAFAIAFDVWQHIQRLLNGEELVVDGRSLDIASVAAVAYHGCLPKITKDAAVLQEMQGSVDVLTHHLERGHFIYGVNTGFGGSADARTTEVQALQVALLQLTQAGVLVASDTGKQSPEASNGQSNALESHAMPASWVRAAVIVRSNSTLRGHSAVSSDIVESLLSLLEHRITPVVPLRGSVSASGDLMPLSYIAGAIEGNPDIYVQVGNSTSDSQPCIMTAADALSSVGLAPRVMKPKEGLSIVNGTSFSAALASLVMVEAHQLAVLVQALSGIAVEALMGSSDGFHPFISAVRPHTGQSECASNILYLLQGSRFVQGIGNEKNRNKSGLVQDRYALRSAPQWIGPQLEDLTLAHRQVTTEINSSCDNPLVDTQSNDIYSGCNFQAASVTSAMEKTRVSLQMLGKLIFSQTTEMIEPHLNNGLPTNLVADDPNLSFTMKGVDINMAAYMAELGYLSHPISAHIQAAEAHNQSVNSMALASSRFSMQAVEILSIMCACHLYVSCQALDLRALHLEFLELAPVALRVLAGEVFYRLSESELARLGTALGIHIAEEWPKLNTLSNEERCRAVAHRSLDVVVNVLSTTESDRVPSVAELAVWRSKAATVLHISYKNIAEQFFNKPHTESLLGVGSRILYKTVRETLGVPLHLGLSEHPTVNDDTLHGRSKKTIGSWISKIYEAIRTGRITGPLMIALRDNVSKDFNFSGHRDAYV